ncbi:hypothetical protein MESS2_1230019 [Mesorhizobium metallidurans STM 2683]|uniref:Transmembrane protein n=1 Tax=Mesorhizobium metallidurans STM 2683 TaxID=1297569 RepID=M5EJE1_9HYPH|nr:hypothetical protein MESS2_1230019 [Mesorhizobium metallidurans STM 2683]
MSILHPEPASLDFFTDAVGVDNLDDVAPDRHLVTSRAIYPACLAAGIAGVACIIAAIVTVTAVIAIGVAAIAIAIAVVAIAVSIVAVAIAASAVFCVSSNGFNPREPRMVEFNGVSHGYQRQGSRSDEPAKPTQRGNGHSASPFVARTEA